MTKEEQKTQTTIRQDTEATLKTYANSMELRISPWDFRLTFGEVIDATEEKITVSNQVIVYMSPQHAKSVAKILARNIKTYEKEFGTIPEVPAPPASKVSKSDQD